MRDIPTETIAVITSELGSKHLSANRCNAITPDHMLDTDLGCNSMDMVCITVALDEEFGTEIPDADVEGWESVADVISTVERLLAPVTVEG